MAKQSGRTGKKSTRSRGTTELYDRYSCGPVQLAGSDNAFYERHITFDHVLAPAEAGPRERFESFARSVRDILSQRWILTEDTYRRENPKRVYYMSMEFLIGRSLANNITNMLLGPHARQLAAQRNLDWIETLEQEPDAGLGNGGLGRLAACFIESMATMQLPAMGYGLRYEYGIFRQSIQDGWQVEDADNWLRRPDPWEVARTHEQVEIRLGCSFEVHAGSLRAITGRPSRLIGIPYDRPVVGYGGKTINTLRLWSAATPDFFNFEEFSSGDFVSALAETLAAESLTRVLYPDDSTSMGQALRFVQEYFLVACSLAERLIPASDVSNQISTAGYEASGTSNMKFMMNGALTIGTRDGATIEMAEEAGEENFFLFGLTAEQVATSSAWYSPYWHYENEPETRAALDLILSDHFSRNEPGVFAPLCDTLLMRGDHYRHLADLQSYLEADGRLVGLHADRLGWARMAILNIAGSGKFSSDRTIAEYAAEIWKAKPCPVP